MVISCTCHSQKNWEFKDKMRQKPSGGQAPPPTCWGSLEHFTTLASPAMGHWTSWPSLLIFQVTSEPHKLLTFDCMTLIYAFLPVPIQ